MVRTAEPTGSVEENRNQSGRSIRASRLLQRDSPRTGLKRGHSTVTVCIASISESAEGGKNVSGVVGGIYQQREGGRGKDGSAVSSQKILQ